jgi:hypothetical protein
LIELVLSMTLFGLVMTAMAAAMLVAFRSDRETADRLASGVDVQFSSASFADDVAGADTTATTPAVAVGGAAACGAGSALVTFASSDIDIGTGTPPTSVPNPAPTTRYVSYVVTAAADGAKELHRRACAAATPAVFTDTAIARYLNAVGTPTVSGKSVSVTLTTTDGNSVTLQGTRRATK